MTTETTPAAPSGTVGADVVCDFIVDWGSPYARDNKNPFCGKPAAWKWTHAVIKSRGAPDIFDKIVTDYYCQAHGERMQGQGGFGDVGKWEHIADNNRLQRPDAAGGNNGQ
jgi:hypothetical protein